MHSFDNGSSLAARKDNWALMSRYFRKRGFETDQDEVDSIIHCEPGAAVAFINRAYTFLTNRRCGPPFPPLCRALRCRGSPRRARHGAHPRSPPAAFRSRRSGCRRRCRRS